MRKYLVILAILLLAAPAWGKNLSEIYPDTTPAEKVTLEDTGDNTEETEVEGAIAEIYGLINAIVSFDWDYDYGDLINTPTIVDWTVSQAPAVIHADNYTDTDTTYSASDFNHDDLSNITGTAAQYNHPTDAQMTVIGNTSNTNTGDETSASIGVLSDNLDDTDASVEWEDAVGLDSDGDLTDEVVQDKVGAMVSGNTETGITATYQDDDGTIDFVVDSASATADGIARLGEVPSGATVPVSPATGDLFYHTPTGRNVLLQYTGSSWTPRYSDGAMTLYVDGTAVTGGTDAIDKGTGTGTDAFATIQYAVDLASVAKTPGSTATINVATGTYSEAVTITGSDITINGTLAEQETLTSATITAGTGAQRGVIHSAGDFAGDSYANLLAYFVTDDEYRVIDGHASTITINSGGTKDIAVGDIIKGATSGAFADVLTVTNSSGSWASGNWTGTLEILVTYGTWQNGENVDNVTDSNLNVATTTSTAAANNDKIVMVGTCPSATSQDVVIYDWGTILSPTEIGLLVNSGLDNINIQNIKSTENVTFAYIEKNSICNIKQISTTSISAVNGSLFIYGGLSLFDSYVYSNSRCYVEGGFNAYGVKFLGHSTSAHAIRTVNGNILLTGCIIDNADAISGAILLRAGTVLQCSSARGYIFLRNNVLAVAVDTGSQAIYTTNGFVYSNNTTDESATAASFGYID